VFVGENGVLRAAGRTKACHCIFDKWRSGKLGPAMEALLRGHHHTGLDKFLIEELGTWGIYI